MYKIVTCAVNNPPFIELQYYLLKKYCKNEYEFIVFNDAKPFPDISNGGNPGMQDEINAICKKHNITCYTIPNPETIKTINDSDRTAIALNHVIGYQIDNPGKYFIIDSDMFPICDFDLSKYNDYAAGIVLQMREAEGRKIHYPWNGLVYMDMHKIPNRDLLDWRCCQYCDTGGMMQKWLSLMSNDDHPTERDIRYTDKQYVGNSIFYIKHLWSMTWDETELPTCLQNDSDLIYYLKNDARNENNKFFCELYDHCFLHFRSGTNWRDRSINYDMNRKIAIYQGLYKALLHRDYEP